MCGEFFTLPKFKPGFFQGFSKSKCAKNNLIYVAPSKFCFAIWYPNNWTEHFFAFVFGTVWVHIFWNQFWVSICMNLMNVGLQFRIRTMCFHFNKHLQTTCPSRIMSPWVKVFILHVCMCTLCPNTAAAFACYFWRPGIVFFPVVLRETATANTIYPQRLAGLCLQIQCEVP